MDFRTFDDVSVPEWKAALDIYHQAFPEPGRKPVRGRGIGRKLVADIGAWAGEERKLSGLLLEAEADPGPANAERIRFWERCGFVRTDYVHKYIWVPETYRAMYRLFGSGDRIDDDGRALFRHIEAFHKKAFAR